MSIGADMDQETKPDIDLLFAQLREIVRKQSQSEQAVTQSDLARLAMQLSDKIDGVERRIDDHANATDALIKERFENMQMKLDLGQTKKIDERLDEKLPISVAHIMADRRKGAAAWIKRNGGLIATAIMLVASLVAFWMAMQGQDVDTAEKVVRGFGKLN